MDKPKILVIGDSMEDRYVFGIATRLSPEAPIPVVSVQDSSLLAGGASNVQNNLKVLGADARICHGVDEKGYIPRKYRLMVGDTQLARWDQFDRVLPVPVERLMRAVEQWQPQAIVLSDYGKGSIDTGVIGWALEQNVPLFVDTKHNPSHFGRVPTFFPNRKEYEEFRPEYEKYAENVVLKRSEAGVARYAQGKLVEEYPAWANKIVSVCGAGDTVIAAYAYAVVTGMKALPFANAAAAVVVGKPWTATATMEEILEVLKGRI